MKRRFGLALIVGIVAALGAVTAAIAADWMDGPGGSGALQFRGSGVYIAGAQNLPLAVVAELTDSYGNVTRGTAGCSQKDGSPLGSGLQSSSIYCIASVSGFGDWVPCEVGDTGYNSCGDWKDEVFMLTLAPGGSRKSDEILKTLLQADGEIGQGKLKSACGRINSVINDLKGSDKLGEFTAEFVAALQKTVQPGIPCK